MARAGRPKVGLVGILPASQRQLRRVAAAIACAAVCSLSGGVLAADAAFPGRNGKLVVELADDGPLNSDQSRVCGLCMRLWTGNEDGSGAAELRTPGGVDLERFRICNQFGWDLCEIGEPAWSRDGQWIAFRAGAASGGQIFVARGDGSRLQAVPGAVGFQPAWSPDGRKIAFEVPERAGDPCADRQIFTITVDGTDRSQLTFAGGTSPDWSIRDQIVFRRARVRSNRDGCFFDGGIYTMTSNGRDQRRIIDRGGEPDWSPGGTRIVFERHVNRDSGIWVIGVDGRHQRRLTRAQDDYDPVWSPDGRVIAFRRGVRLFSVARFGGPARALRFNPKGLLYRLDWQPLSG